MPYLDTALRKSIICTVVLLVGVGGVAAPGVADDAATTNTEEPGPIDSSYDADPENGTLTSSVSTEADDRTVQTIVLCDLSDGTITACAVYNTPPVSAAEVVGQMPESVQNETDGQVVGLVDLTVRDPQSGIFLVANIVNSEIPEQSPISSVLNPGYPITNPPFNPAAPNESLDPGVEQQPADSPAPGVIVRINDRVNAGATPGIQSDQGVVSTEFDVSDGHNEHHITVFGTETGVYSATDGPVNGTAAVSESDQHATFIVDLGGQPYIVSVGPSSGANGSQPIGPYNGEEQQTQPDTTTPTEMEQDDSQATATPDGPSDGESTPTATPTATPDESKQGESSPTPTPTESRQDDVTPTPTAYGEQTNNTSTGSAEGPSTPADETRSTLPGFGVVTAVLALLVAAVLARRSW